MSLMTSKWERGGESNIFLIWLSSVFIYPPSEFPTVQSIYIMKEGRIAVTWPVFNSAGREDKWRKGSGRYFESCVTSSLPSQRTQIFPDFETKHFSVNSCSEDWDFASEVFGIFPVIINMLNASKNYWYVCWFRMKCRNIFWPRIGIH